VSHISSVVKRAALGAAKSIGMYELVGNSAWRRRRLAILCYHGVSLVDEHEWDPRLFHSAAVFRQRMETLRTGGYTVLPLADGLTRLAAGTLPDRSVVITFDDGLYDFAAIAAPILQEFGFPATVYVSTYYAQHPWPVFSPWCRYMLWRARERTLDLAAVIGDGPRIALQDSSPREAAAHLILDHCNRVEMSGAARDELAQRLEAHLGIDGAAWRARRILHLMTPDEVANVSRAGFDIQLHTHRHRTPDDVAAFREEIRHNRSLLQEWTGMRLDHFAYPSGVHRPEYLDWLAGLGVTSAVTSESGLATTASHPLLLPRVIDQESLHASEFHAWLCGVRALLPSRVNVAALKQVSPEGRAG
jgi:peptidoglycan/xylan/chitin deacetylase (PgdA/CDA1 family)